MAKDADEYCAIVYEILNEHNVHHFIKSKSMLAEECGLNPFLMERGIDVVESDLGERILQLMHLEPSHIVLPAIHIKREQVGELFEKEMGTEKGNFDPTYLTHAARKNLRHLFLNAEAAMTGANFAVASTGDIVVCTNEGNADMGTSYPKLNIAAFGMEKIVPDLEALGYLPVYWHVRLPDNRLQPTLPITVALAKEVNITSLLWTMAGVHCCPRPTISRH
ncbi:hypothetical protein BFINE_26760 [Bacteroides finegoldii DSM 17565]|nr:hypothetical protein BFINE_26760 [Bacteroides finegoldii DSM 17565]